MSAAGSGRLPPVFLVGFMCSGKTTVGRLLAAHGGARFIDTDELVAARAGKGIERILADSGESELRRLELEIFDSLGEARGAVVATGGGAFLAYRLRRLMGGTGRTVWLDVPLSVARRRRGQDPAARPIWSESDPVRFRAFFERRRAIYALAHLRVDAAGPPERVADAVRIGLSARKI